MYQNFIASHPKILSSECKLLYFTSLQTVSCIKNFAVVVTNGIICGMMLMKHSSEIKTMTFLV
jgi:hypothetical protein